MSVLWLSLGDKVALDSFLQLGVVLMIVNEQHMSSVRVIFGAKPVFQKQLVMLKYTCLGKLRALFVGAFNRLIILKYMLGQWHRVRDICVDESKQMD